jgi:hypothetical protein
MRVTLKSCLYLLLGLILAANVWWHFVKKHRVGGGAGTAIGGGGRGENGGKNIRGGKAELVQGVNLALCEIS